MPNSIVFTKFSGKFPPRDESSFQTGANQHINHEQSKGSELQKGISNCRLHFTDNLASCQAQWSGRDEVLR